MVHIITEKEEKLPPLDYKAGRQIFDREHTAREPIKFGFIKKDTTNPIDVKLRQLAIEFPTGGVNLKKIFFNLNAVIIWGDGMPQFIKGKIKDVFLHTRDVYVKTRKGDIYIVPFEKVREISEREL